MQRHGRQPRRLRRISARRVEESTDTGLCASVTLNEMHPQVISRTPRRLGWSPTRLGTAVLLVALSSTIATVE